MKTLLRRAAALLIAAPAAAASFLPAPFLAFDVSPQALQARCKSSQDRASKALDAVAAVPAASRTFDNTPAALDRALAALAEDTASDQFLKNVAVSSGVREAATECEAAVKQFVIGASSREDLYRAFKDYAGKGEPLSGEAKRLLDKQMLDFRRSGLELPADKRAELTATRQKIADLESRFTHNIDEDKGFALFTREELDGASEDYVSRLEKADGRYKVTLAYPDYFPFMENVRAAASRRVIDYKFDNRAADANVPLFEEALGLRLKAARLLGQPSHAAFVLEDRMAKTPRTVDEFLGRLAGRLKPLAERELEVLRALKRDAEGPSSDSVIRSWDWYFYDNQLKKTKYAVDQQKIKEYFPADLVVEKTLEIYQTLLGLRLRRVPGAAAWHPDVELYEVADAEDGRVLGWFYLDLFPREGKYSHAAVQGLVVGRELPGGGYQRPISAMIANLAKPAPGKPSLLEHKQVETFFHEFGHVMHNTLSKTRFARLSGFAASVDFVEAPSQMLENWVWNARSLERLSGHYQDRSKPLPRELADRLLASRNVNAGLFNLRQIFFGTFDLACHSPQPPADTTTAYARLRREVSLIPAADGTHRQASFGHFMGGYDAAYYGYLWSKVYAQDMFSRFEEEGILNAALGRRYRREVLEPGASRDELDSVRAFLGREPREDAFLRSVGLGAR